MFDVGRPRQDRGKRGFVISRFGNKRVAYFRFFGFSEIVRSAIFILKIAYNTALRGIMRLEKAGIVAEVSEAKRDRIYCAKALLDILEEPARLTPMEGE